MISNEELKKLKNYLKNIKNFSEKEDWEEYYAQELIMDGGLLYDEIFNDDFDGNQT